jgi:hypothetical protein
MKNRRETVDHGPGSNSGRIPQANLPGRCYYHGRDDRLIRTGSDRGNEDSVNDRNCTRLRRSASPPNQTSLAPPQLSGSSLLSLARSYTFVAPCAKQPVRLHPQESTTILDRFVHPDSDLRNLRPRMPMACASSASSRIAQSVRPAFATRRARLRIEPRLELSLWVLLAVLGPDSQSTLRGACVGLNGATTAIPTTPTFSSRAASESLPALP